VDSAGGCVDVGLEVSTGLVVSSKEGAFVGLSAVGDSPTGIAVGVG
jgi:hypothetical protein